MNSQSLRYYKQNQFSLQQVIHSLVYVVGGEFVSQNKTFMWNEKLRGTVCASGWFEIAGLSSLLQSPNETFWRPNGLPSKVVSAPYRSKHSTQTLLQVATEGQSITSEKEGRKNE